LLLRTGLAAALLALTLLARASADVDPRPAVIELEWRTPTGYERCAGVITARRPPGLVAWTAGHCATQPFSVVRFFDGYEIYGSAVRVLSRSESSDAASLFLPLDPARAARTAVALASRAVPPLGSTLTIVGHPVSALLGPNQGRWTVTYGRMGPPGANPETNAFEYEVYCARCGPGDSGSGVFDADGGLVGIVYGVTEIENVAGGRLPDGLYADVVPAAALR
jgi:hypothetical protein